MRAFLIAFLSAAASLSLHAQNVVVMTQNMDEGTNESYVLAFANSNLKLGVDLTLAEVVGSGVPERANALAARIAAEKPDIVGLQEVGLWRFGLTPATANFVLYDQLQLLLNALKAHGVPYRAVTVNNLTDLALPATIGAVRLTDRDALLVRADSSAQVQNPQNHIFRAAFPFGSINIEAGWISADVQVGAKIFRLISTHLMSAIAGIQLATDIQVNQTRELIAALQGLPFPVVISGDLNSDANGGSGPDATPSVALIKADGYVDGWLLRNPGNPGTTWPLFLQDQTPPHFFAPAVPFERIDVFLSKGISMLSGKTVTAPAPGTLPGFGSDHAGVIAAFQP